MLSSNRLHYLAIGGCLAFLLLAIPALGQEAGGPDVAPPAPQQTEPPQADSGGPPAATAPAEEQPSSAVEQDAEYDAEHHAKADLAAQESMAASTGALVQLTDLQITITAIEAGFLAVTIIFTAWAAIAASNAARAADRAIEVTQEGIERQLRAYVCVTAADVKWESNRVAKAVILVKNTGQTPAKHVTSWTTIAMGRKTDFPAPDDLGGGSKGIIGTNSPYTLQSRTAPLDDQTWGQIRNRNVPLWVWGEISYDDIFDKERRRTSFRLLLHDKEDLLHPVSDGNDAT